MPVAPQNLAELEQLIEICKEHRVRTLRAGDFALALDDSAFPATVASARPITPAPSPAEESAQRPVETIDGHPIDERTLFWSSDG